jgi:GDP-D-mannose 3',5'-epimerase
MSQFMDKDDLIVLTGGGGFIGGHLVADLIRNGYSRIRSVDIKPVDDWYQVFPEAENLQLDRREKAACYQAVSGARFVFNLASDMAR